MSYLMLIMERADRRKGRPPEQAAMEWERMVSYAGSLNERGVLEAAQSLKSVAHGTRIEKRNGKTNVVDGPFAEAKEIVGGFYYLKNVDRDEALAIAANCPAAEWCSIELREVGPCSSE
ncbi:MAG: dehydrogenase [Rudaea sp.]|uniref:YciI family protein n=1 Tax=unclassified Rudaea TaxID=2627037 RepID=UPI0010F905B2|nr:MULTISPECIES: YciI family protein [unclassified Rudaea]MBN8885302.1 dehydrogenase [Rudaea sp.]MBR0345707.1 dehydrogenase [Rudaea sp.]